MNVKIKTTNLSGGLSGRYQLIALLVKEKSRKYPAGFIAAMVLLMAFSALIAFTNRGAAKPVTAFTSSLADYPLGPLESSPAALLEVLSLQAELKSFSAKSPPSSVDSVRMEQILLRIQELNRKLVKK